MVHGYGKGYGGWLVNQETYFNNSGETKGIHLWFSML